MKRLNNLVVELAAAEGPQVAISFTNPRDGWISFAVTGDVRAGERVRLALDGPSSSPVATPLGEWREGAPRIEAMRFLPAGSHTLRLHADGRPRIAGVAVRAVAELAYCKHQYDPHIREYGPYDWAFLKRHVLDHVNTVVGGADPAHRPCVQEWKARGGRWIVECGVAGMSAETISPDEAYEAWATNPGMADPIYDGLIVDEFFGGDNAKYPAWTEAVRRLAADFPGKRFCPYFGGHWPDRSDWLKGEGNTGPESSRQFLRAVLDAGFPVAWERYLQERHEPEIALQLMDDRLGAGVDYWQTVFPGCARQLVVALGYMTITETLDIHPSVDYKVFMDLQFQYLATRPQFDGLYGILEYTSGYADEETVRWAARLMRHYGIEGNRDLLSPRYGFTYKPNHLWNGDFNHGLEGWSQPIWIEESTEARALDGYSHLQGRWPGTSVGNTFLWMRRRSDRDNTLGQEIRNLTPGKLYSAKMITADWGELQSGTSTRREHGLSLSIAGAEIIPEKTFLSVVANNYSHTYGPFAGDNKFWFNYHQVVFRAKGATAHLDIADWADGMPAGPVGQELICNFVEVQPYFEG